MRFRRNSYSNDILLQKQEELAVYQGQFDDAVSAVTMAARNLEQINEKIEEKLKEIDVYQENLASTRAGLDKAKNRNAQVIRNFNALLGVEEEEA